MSLQNCFSCCVVDAHFPQGSKWTFSAAVNFTHLYHVLYSVVNCHSVFTTVQTEFVIDVWLSGARLTRLSYFNYFWMWLWSGFGWASLALCHILTFAVGMQSEGVSCWRVKGERVYKENNAKDTQKLSWCWCGKRITTGCVGCLVTFSSLKRIRQG